MQTLPILTVLKQAVPQSMRSMVWSTNLGGWKLSCLLCSSCNSVSIIIERSKVHLQPNYPIPLHRLVPKSGWKTLWRVRQVSYNNKSGLSKAKVNCLTSELPLDSGSGLQCQRSSLPLTPSLLSLALFSALEVATSSSPTLISLSKRHVVDMKRFT